MAAWWSTETEAIDVHVCVGRGMGQGWIQFYVFQFPSMQWDTTTREPQYMCIHCCRRINEPNEMNERLS